MYGLNKTLHMKRFFLLLFSILPMIVAAQGHKGTVESCAPTREGKVLYSDKVEVKDSDRQEIFQSIHAWAKENYGKDVFISSVSANKNKGTLFIGSKVELLLNDSEKTIVKYKMRINCQDNGYSVRLPTFLINIVRVEKLRRKHIRPKMLLWEMERVIRLRPLKTLFYSATPPISL